MPQQIEIITGKTHLELKNNANRFLEQFTSTSVISSPSFEGETWYVTVTYFKPEGVGYCKLTSQEQDSYERNHVLYLQKVGVKLGEIADMLGLEIETVKDYLKEQKN